MSWIERETAVGWSGFCMPTGLTATVFRAWGAAVSPVLDPDDAFSSGAAVRSVLSSAGWPVGADAVTFFCRDTAPRRRSAEKELPSARR
ncbi:MAG: hypothetical protein WAQ08_15855, partial [Aquabacterium sp.]|uniref:hypothetical protein n=1 Tax=Aquabacterium sp. TaxID=1872578 RepID=UPI003BB179F2